MKNNFFKVSIPILLIIIAAFYLTTRFIQEPVKKELSIASGPKTGTYYKIALQYKELLKKQKVKLTIIETTGSLENIKVLKNKKVDLAFMQNGAIQDEDNSNISSLGNIYYEPLWVFYKNENYRISYLVELTSKKISIGVQNSGTNHLSSLLLNQNGINSNNSKLLTFDTKTSYEKLLKGEIDAMFIVGSHNISTVQKLLENPNINILNIKRAKAYSRKYSFLEALDLYEGTVDLYKNIPDENIKLLSTTATIVTNDDVPDELIRIFLKQIKLVHENKDLFKQNNQFPNLDNIDLKINKEANQYFTSGDTFLESIFPYWIASNIDRLKILLIPLLTLMLPLMKGFFPLYIWSMRSKIYKWYKKLKKYDKNLNSLSREVLEERLLILENLKDEIRNETSVPASFMGEYYNLILHIELICKKINSILAKTN